MKEYNISNLEIENILNIAPMFDVLKYDEFIENCLVLVRHGYPKIDLDFLILTNPNIFVQAKNDLENVLMKLEKQYGDIEQVLKNNPLII